MSERPDPSEPSLFTPENLLREARRQKGIREQRIPRVCVLDPDGDVAAYLLRGRRAVRDPGWACYHTEMLDFVLAGVPAGVVANAVGSPFAVLVAEEMFASGCEILLSLTSAGRVNEGRILPRFLVIQSALRDEGTSAHYGASGRECRLEEGLLRTLQGCVAGSPVPLGVGTSWTTDAPFRETASAVRRARELGADCVEMEASALYAFARARGKRVICLAHVTNTMAQAEGDFEKGEEDGAIASLALLAHVLRALDPRLGSQAVPNGTAGMERSML